MVIGGNNYWVLLSITVVDWTQSTLSFTDPETWVRVIRLSRGGLNYFSLAVIQHVEL